MTSVIIQFYAIVSAGRVVYHICLKMPCVNQGGVDVGQFDS